MDEPATRARWHRNRRTGRWCLAVGLVLLIVFVVWVTVDADHADDLGARGATAPGVVLADPPRALVCTEEPVPVEWYAGATREVHDYQVDTCGQTELGRGDHVTVAYGPHHPGDFTVDGDPNESGAVVWPQIIALVLGFSLVAFAVAVQVQSHRARVVLEHHPWRRLRARVVRTSGRGDRRARQLLEVDDSGVATRLLRVPGRMVAPDPPEVALDAAGAGGGRWVLRQPGSDDYRLARARPVRPS